MTNHTEQEKIFALSQKFVSNSDYDKNDLVEFLKFFWTHMYEREKAKTDDTSEKAMLLKRYESILANLQSSEWKAVSDLPLEEIQELTFTDLAQIIQGKSVLLDEASIQNAVLIPKTKQPKKFIVPKDKVTNTLFDGKLIAGSKDVLIGMEGRKSKKELTAVVSIDFEDLPNVTISKTITAFDREVHDAIVSLYVDGKNEFVTPLMIYRTMTGDPKAKINPKKAEAISNSVTKCSMTRIIIDSSDEADAFEMDKLYYEGNLIYTKKVKGEHNGKISEWIYIMEQPILYTYAKNKKQIARTDINLLNTPINKSDEVIILQGYLLRRILAMQGSKLNRNILYETIYKHLEISASSPGALRKKQHKVRDMTKEILDDWVIKKFIKNYDENVKNNSIISVTIHT